MSLRTPPWITGALLVIALVPLGSAPTRAEFVLVTATTLTFLALVAWRLPSLGVVATAETLLGGIHPVALLGPPIYIGAQIAAAILLDYTSGAPAEMMRAGMVAFVTLLFYCIVYSSIRDLNSFRAVLSIVMLVGLAEAIYGLFNLLAGNERLLFLYARSAYLDSATGTLVNRNHFALLMEMALPLTLITATARSYLPQRHGTRRNDDVALQALLSLACAIVGVALVFSRSRMGLLSLALSFLVVLPAAHLLRPRNQGGAGFNRVGVGIPLMVGTLIACYVLVIGAVPAFERFANLATDLETGRLPIWRAGVAMAMDHPLVGHGWGTFDFLVDGYKDLPTGLDTAYAHNDYLQVFAEAGVIGLLYVLWFLAFFAQRLLTALPRDMPDFSRFAITWLGLSIFTALVHSAADFGLRIPGVGFMFAAIVALFVRVSEEPTFGLSRRRKRRRRSADSAHQISHD